MMKLMCLLLAIMLLFSGCAAAEDGGDDELEAILSGMTLRDKVCQMMIVSARIWKEVPETEEAEKPAEEPPAVNMTELNEPVREMLSRNHFGGVLLFGENFQDAGQTLKLVADFQTDGLCGSGRRKRKPHRLQHHRCQQHGSRCHRRPGECPGNGCHSREGNPPAGDSCGFCAGGGCQQ